MLLSVVGACTQIPSDVISPRGRRNHVSPPTRLTLVLFILIPKQITGIAIPLLHGVVVIASETTTTLHMQDRVATICASDIVIFPSEGYIKVLLETDILSLGNLVFKYLHLPHVLMILASTTKQCCFSLTIRVKVKTRHEMSHEKSRPHSVLSP